MLLAGVEEVAVPAINPMLQFDDMLLAARRRHRHSIENHESVGAIPLQCLLDLAKIRLLLELVEQGAFDPAGVVLSHGLQIREGRRDVEAWRWNKDK